MRAADIVGRRVVSVDQERGYNGHLREMETTISGFRLDNGTYIALTATETEDEPRVTALVIKKSKKQQAEGGA